MSKPSQEQIAAIRLKLEEVKAALRDNTVNVLNPAHHAQWSDVEYLLDAVEAQRSDPPGSLGEAGARLRALVTTWRGPAAQNATLRGYLETANTLQCCANELEAILDALLSAPVVSPPLEHAAKLLALSLTDEMLDSLRADYGHTNVAVLKHWKAEVLSLSAPVVTQEGEEPCP